MNDNNFFDIQYLTKEFLDTIKDEFEIYQFVKNYGANWEGLIPGSLVLVKFNGHSYDTYRFNFTKNKKRLYKDRCQINGIYPEYFIESYTKVEFDDIINNNLMTIEHSSDECLHIDTLGKSTWYKINQPEPDERQHYRCSKCKIAV